VVAAGHEHAGDHRSEELFIPMTVHGDRSPLAFGCPARRPQKGSAYRRASTMGTVGIFTGRGGSGTRLLSQLATDAGVFLGNQVNHSGDSVEWVDLIYRMVVETAGQRDLPTGSRYRRELRAQAERTLGTARRCDASVWGLKLPETMLVLSLLIDAFPEARVIHLTRHPVSVSLRRTHMTSRLGNPVGDVTLPGAYRYVGRDPSAIPTDEPYLHNAYAWNFQVTRVIDYGREALGAAQYLEMAYEDACAEPLQALAMVRSFLGCGDSQAGASTRVDPARTGAWDAADARVQAIWAICGETAGRLGYASDPDASQVAPPIG